MSRRARVWAQASAMKLVSFNVGDDSLDTLGDGDPDEIEDDGDGYCPECNGSGEGFHDGARCRRCGGDGAL
jgi:hypothetical protein